MAIFNSKLLVITRGYNVYKPSNMKNQGKPTWQDTLDKIRHDSLSRSPGSGATQISNARSMLATGQGIDGDWISSGQDDDQKKINIYIYTSVCITIYIVYQYISRMISIYEYVVYTIKHTYI